ncbi:flavodoxin family protein [Psychrilyobacter atlanticus]|uniref:flavodoxin family protein n=1 Tax=Psychrilyobacter atlanticus TaxID=271091 RepID=UPI00042576B2|nr:flavodoxin [Psychrilyobacter atlanticus]
MKKIVIFYSFEGDTKMIAENIAQAIDADILELKPKQDLKSKGFMKYVWGGKAAITHKQPELLPLNKDINSYDILFIGTPVWAWTYAPALNTFFSAHLLLDKKIALFCCHGGGKGKIFDHMNDALKDNQILGEIDFQDPLKNNTDKNIEKAKKWAEKIIETL